MLPLSRNALRDSSAKKRKTRLMEEDAENDNR